MNRINNFTLCSGEKVKLLASSLVLMFSFLVTTLSANTTCCYFAHQPEVPKTAKKLRKF